MYKKSTLLNKINLHLTVLVSAIRNKNNLFLTDDNKWSEDFFKELLNTICGLQLVNLNVTQKNYAGIDLGDSNSHICVQVTATNDSKKIQDTLDISNQHKRHEQYDGIVILIIGYKKKYTKDFNSTFTTFDKVKDIWDIRTILEKVSLLDVDQMQKIAEYLDKQLETIININPLDLLDEDISNIIDLLCEYLKDEATSDSQKQYSLIKRDDDFISRKNQLNNVSEILFNNEIRPSLQYDKKIEDFLGNPINKEYQRKYFVITDSFQKKYSENTEQFSSIGALFGFIFDEVINYDNRTAVDDQKLLIVLHNMYFNCDIGNNPS